MLCLPPSGGAVAGARHGTFTRARDRRGAIPEEPAPIAAFLDTNRDNYKKGQGQGGQVDTAGYALWTLQLGRWEPDPTTCAVAEYLLLRDAKLDHWRATSNRPPSEVSPFTTTYAALRGLDAYATAEQDDRVRERFEQARAWLDKATARDTEDRVFRLRAFKLARAGAASLRAAAQELVERSAPTAAGVRPTRWTRMPMRRAACLWH